MEQISYTVWEKEVNDYLTGIKQLLDQNEEAKNLYNGFYVWDSKLILNPKVMFIGINPGNGNPENSGEIVTMPETQMSYLEYLDGDNPTYTLARETVEIFKILNYSENEIRTLLNDNSVKTNFFFIITANQSQIKQCLNTIGKRQEYLQRSFHFIGQLIQIINPRYIICEGKSVFDNVKEFYSEDEYEEKWAGDVGTLKIKNSELIYFGYKRNLNKHNNIKNIEQFSELLKPYLGN